MSTKKPETKMHESDGFEIVSPLHEGCTAFPDEVKEKDSIIKDLLEQLAEAKARATIITKPNAVGLEVDVDRLRVARDTLRKELDYDLSSDEDLCFKLAYLGHMQSRIIAGIETFQAGAIGSLLSKEAEMVEAFKEYTKEKEERSRELDAEVESVLSTQQVETEVKERLNQTLAQLQTAQAAAMLFESKCVESTNAIKKMRSQIELLEADKEDLSRQLVCTRRECRRAKSDLSKLASSQQNEKVRIDRSTAVETDKLQSVAVELMEKERRNRNQIYRLTRKIRTERLESANMNMNA